MASYDDYNYDVYDDDYVYEDAAPEETEPVDESGYRNTWEILTWIIIALTIVLNLILIGILVLRRNLHSIVNKSKNCNFCTLSCEFSNFCLKICNSQTKHLLNSRANVKLLPRKLIKYQEVFYFKEIIFSYFSNICCGH